MVIKIIKIKIIRILIIIRTFVNKVRIINLKALNIIRESSN